MPDPYLVQPDTEFLRRIVGEGGEDLKSCFQCGTCSVVCNLSEGGQPFPRKEMIWAQWGLRDRLLADPDIWRCHQCNDCSTHCPRGAQPGDVMAALRRECVLEHSVPRFLAHWANQLKYLPVLLAIPAVLLGLLVKAPIKNTIGSKIVYPYWPELPHWVLISFFSFFGFLALLAVVAGVVRFWGAMKAADARAGITTPAKSLGSSIVSVLKSIITHDHFSNCTTDRSRMLSHLAVFWGFIALLAVAIWVIFISLTASFNPLIQDDFVYPFNFWSPWRMLANLGGLAVVAGCLLMIWERLKKGEQGVRSTFFDWVFVGTLLAVVLTGFLSEALHYARLDPHRFAAYFVHLVCVFALWIYLPYSKFAHLVYRTAAMVYIEYSGRNNAVPVTGADGKQEGEKA